MKSLTVVLLFLFISEFCSGNLWKKGRETHKARSLKTDSMKDLNNGYDENRFERYLDAILIERVPGTPGHKKVQQYIKDTIESFGGWTIEEDSFEEDTPYGIKDFNNIVAIFNPHAPRKLSIACHYDSKLIPNFVAATDSAVPCAMMLELAYTLTDKLKNQRNAQVTLELIFFDGEEAFKQWTSTDSIYGARHLADKMSETVKTVEREIQVTGLDQMNLLILLDLIGAGNCKFHNWFRDDSVSAKAYDRMKKTEEKLRKQKLLEGPQNYFPKNEQYFHGNIEDDHIPFLRKDVPVLHLICYPFPAQWHKSWDDKKNLDWKEIHDITLMLKIFTCEYLGLSCSKGL